MTDIGHRIRSYITLKYFSSFMSRSLHISIPSAGWNVCATCFLPNSSNIFSSSTQIFEPYRVFVGAYKFSSRFHKPRAALTGRSTKVLLWGWHVRLGVSTWMHMCQKYLTSCETRYDSSGTWVCQSSIYAHCRASGTVSFANCVLISRVSGADCPLNVASSLYCTSDACSLAVCALTVSFHCFRFLGHVLLGLGRFWTYRCCLVG